MAENKDKRELENIDTVEDATKENTDEKKDEYEEICYICRRPESVAGQMIKIPNNICICKDCMQRTFDSMNNSGFPMGDFMPNGQMPNISMINLSDLQGFMPQSQKIKKKKTKIAIIIIGPICVSSYVNILFICVLRAYNQLYSFYTNNRNEFSFRDYRIICTSCAP